MIFSCFVLADRRLYQQHWRFGMFWDSALLVILFPSSSFWLTVMEGVRGDVDPRIECQILKYTVCWWVNLGVTAVDLHLYCILRLVYAA